VSTFSQAAHSRPRKQDSRMVRACYGLSRTCGVYRLVAVRTTQPEDVLEECSGPGCHLRAIGLAVPMVVLIAGGVAARLGIIFRDPSMLETARNVTDVVFDKTVSRIKLLIEPLGGYMIWRHANGAVIFREPSLVDLQSSPTYRTSAITQIKSGAFS
jgi:hypothetical protein